MNKKHTFKKVAAMLLGIALTIGATGCGFVTKDSQKDLEQVVAKVDISAQLASSDKYASVAEDVTKLIKQLDTSITKRELISYYMSTGYQYVESYGYTYEKTFNMLLDGLIDREILIQHAVAYYLQSNSNLTAANCETYVNQELNAAGLTAKTKELFTAHKEVLVLKYLLTNGGENLDAYNKGVYTVKKSLNDTLDSMETSYITAESEEHNHEKARTLPTNVGTQKDDYFTTDYEVYTGRNLANTCGTYKQVDGSTITSRQKAYNAFLTNLNSYSLINTEEGKVENTANITELNYYYVELASVLGQNLINKYFESLEASVNDVLTAEYVQEKLNEQFEQDKKSYEGKPVEFLSAMDEVGEDSFLMYGLNGFGYVYNILLPFSTSQTVKYNEAKNRGLTQEQLYKERRNILTQIQAKDLRDTWISEHDHANYSNVLNADYQDGAPIYFFQNQMAEDSEYKTLTHYAGNYPFNGTVTKSADGELEVKSNAVNIDEFMGIFKEYVATTAGVSVTGDVVTKYSDDAKNFIKEDGEVDYDKFVYYRGQVALSDTDPANVFNKENVQYKAISAVNELLFAYGTDPGALNTYLGYSVTPYTTSFVKEFEYAAQEIVKAGAGNYIVCATDYGWHIMYCTVSYTADGAVYTYNHDDRDTEGTFSNLFYQYVKEAAYANHASEEQNRVLLAYDNEDSVTRYQKRYQDLLDMDN